MVLDTGPREAATNKTGAKVLASPGTLLDTAAASAADSERAVHDHRDVQRRRSCPDWRTVCASRPDVGGVGELRGELGRYGGRAMLPGDAGSRQGDPGSVDRPLE